MSDTNNVTELPAPPPPAKPRGRPRGAAAPTARKRRDYARENAEMQQRVDTAVRLIAKCSDCKDAALTVALLRVAIETLRPPTYDDDRR